MIYTKVFYYVIKRNKSYYFGYLQQYDEKVLFYRYQIFIISGSYQHQGMLIEYFINLYYDNKNQYLRKNNRFYFTMFSTVGKPNHYIDLLTGQRYTFFSKKDVYSYKSFFSRQIISLQDFLIALKIAMIRYQQCCDQMDFIVFRLTLQTEEDFQEGKAYQSTGNVILTHRDNKYLDSLIKNIYAVIRNDQSGKMTDHGGLFSCLEEYIKNGKISIIQCLLNESDDINSNLPFIKQLQKYSSLKCRFHKNPSTSYLTNLLSQVASSSSLPILSIPLVISKQSSLLKNISLCYKTFVTQTRNKLEMLIGFYNRIHQIREEFYQKERFSVATEVKMFQDTTFMVKSYYIAKIYSLSEKFQMENIEPICEKMKTIKNQIVIALKSLTSFILQSFPSLTKQPPIQLSPLQQSFTILTKFSTPKSLTPQQTLCQLLLNELDRIKINLRLLLNIDQIQLSIKCLDNHVRTKEEKRITRLDAVELDKVLNGRLLAWFDKTISIKRKNISAQVIQDSRITQQRLDSQRSTHKKYTQIDQNHSFTPKKPQITRRPNKLSSIDCSSQITHIKEVYQSVKVKKRIQKSVKFVDSLIVNVNKISIYDDTKSLQNSMINQSTQEKLQKRQNKKKKTVCQDYKSKQKSMYQMYKKSPPKMPCQLSTDQQNPPPKRNAKNLCLTKHIPQNPYDQIDSSNYPSIHNNIKKGNLLQINTNVIKAKKNRNDGKCQIIVRNDEKMPIISQNSQAEDQNKQPSKIVLLPQLFCKKIR